MIAVGICALVLSVGAFVSVPKGLERVSFLRLPDRRIRLRRAEMVDHEGGSYRDPPKAAMVALDDIKPQRAGWVAVRAQTTLHDGHLVLSARYFPLAPFLAIALCILVGLPMNVEAKVVHLSGSFVAALYMLFAARASAERVLALMEADLRRRVG